MKSDVEIAREHVALPLEEIANRAGLLPKELCYYGKNKAKIDQEAIERVQQNEPGKLVLVTAITPTPAGEGKTTVSIGLADGLNLKGVKTMLAPVSYTHLVKTKPFGSCRAAFCLPRWVGLAAPLVRMQRL